MTIEKAKKGKKNDKEEKPSPGIGLLLTFSFNLFALALINRNLNVSGNVVGWEKTITSNWYYLAFLGIIFLLFGLYFKLPKHKAQEWFLKNVFNKYTLQAIKLIGWAIVLVLFGTALIKSIQTNWSAAIGLICIGAGIGFLVSGIIYGVVTSIKITETKKYSHQK